jgi:hypothetical protein
MLYISAQSMQKIRFLGQQIRSSNSQLLKNRKLAVRHIEFGRHFVFFLFFFLEIHPLFSSSKYAKNPIFRSTNKIIKLTFTQKS